MAFGIPADIQYLATPGQGIVGGNNVAVVMKSTGGVMVIKGPAVQIISLEGPIK